MIFPSLPWSSPTSTPSALDVRQWLFLVLLALTSISVGAFSSSQVARQKSHSTKHDHQHSDVEKTVVIAYYKPANVITSHNDPEALAAVSKSGVPRRTCYEDIMSMKGCIIDENKKDPRSWEECTGIQSKLHAIGRLDCDTTGLLLLTNDGGLVHHVTNPQSFQKTTSATNTITKTYEALIMGHHENDCDSFERMRTEGVNIGKKYGGQTKPVDQLSVLEHPTTKSTLVSITISEGKNRQVRRMFHAIGSGVMQLKRTNIGNKLSLKGLKEGQWRVMSDAEVEDYLGWEPQRIENRGQSNLARSSKSFGNTKRVRNSPKKRSQHNRAGR